MQPHNSGGSRTRQRVLVGIGAAALTVPLAFTSTAAFAAPEVSSDGIAAITAGNYLPDYLSEFAGQVDDAAVFEHVRHLAVDIGPRVAGTSAEVAANTYVKEQLDAYGFTTETESFPVGASLFANATPDRDLPSPQVSWQYRPAENTLFTGADAPVQAQVADIGDGATYTPEQVAGKFVLVTSGGTAAARTQLMTGLATAGAAGIIFANTNANQALANPGIAPAEAAGIQVVGASLYQGERIRALLATGPLSLSLTTERSSTTSTNTIGVRPAVGDTDGTAPIVYIGAHIDSVVGSPGASDNASGVGIMLESARILSQYALDTEIRVGTWGAEEKGIIGSKVHATSLTPKEIERTVGAWNMDMAGTSHLGTEDKPFGFWGLSLKKDGMQNSVLNHADALSGHTERGPLNRGFVARSDHESFQNVGIEAAVFSWMFWSESSSIVLEPTYHQSNDTIDFVSQERMGVSAEIIGGSAFRAAMNTVTVDVVDEKGAPVEEASVAMTCGDDEGWRSVGETAADGSVSTLAPTVECDFAALGAKGATGAAVDQQVTRDGKITIELLPDTTPATITFSDSAGTTPNEAGWYTSPLAIEIAAADAPHAAPAVEVSRNGTDWEAYTEAISIDTDGVNEVFARATDLGGTPTEVSQEFPLDRVAPTLSVSADEKSRGNVTAEASDATSGVEDVQFRILPDGEWVSLMSSAGEAAGSGAAAMTAAAVADELTGTLPLGTAATTAEFRALDVAGHASETVSITFPAGESVTPDPEPKPEPEPKQNPGEKTPAKTDVLAATGGPSLLGYGALAGALLLLSGGALVIARRRAVTENS